MKNRSIKKVYPAFRDDIDDLKTVRPLPSPLIRMIDPFLFLNHHGPQTYSPKNEGLPFGPHPHRGFQTVTFILDGDIAHRDTAGNESVIGPGGVQWMSAGRGLVHEEISSEQFKRTGGPLEILQLWINLPKKFKMSEPNYLGLQRNEIPEVRKDQVQVQVIAGNFEGIEGAFKPSTSIRFLTIDMKENSQIKIDIPEKENIFFYVVRGDIQVNGLKVSAFNLVEFNNDNTEVEISARAPAFVLIGHAEPYNEPVVFGGPFVMNTEEEVRQAFRDYQAGRLT